MEYLSRWTFGQSAAQACEAKGLTKREREVLMWVIRGKTNGEIGTILGISIHTVCKHIEHVFLKLGAHSRVQAIHKILEVAQHEVNHADDQVEGGHPPRAEVA